MSCLCVTWLEDMRVFFGPFALCSSSSKHKATFSRWGNMVGGNKTWSVVIVPKQVYKQHWNLYEFTPNAAAYHSHVQRFAFKITNSELTGMLKYLRFETQEHFCSLPNFCPTDYQFQLNFTGNFVYGQKGRTPWVYIWLKLEIYC